MKSPVEIIFWSVAKSLMALAKMLGTTYNAVNVVVYYFLIPLSWIIMIDMLIGWWYFTAIFCGCWIGVLVWTRGRFKAWCDVVFLRSQNFLRSFKSWNWDYSLSSVIICVIIPIIIYVVLICMHNKEAVLPIIDVILSNKEINLCILWGIVGILTIAFFAYIIQHKEESLGGPDLFDELGMLYEAGFRNRFPFDYLLHLGEEDCFLKAKGFEEIGYIAPGSEMPGIEYVYVHDDLIYNAQVILDAPLYGSFNTIVTISDKDGNEIRRVKYPSNGKIDQLEMLMKSII